MIDFCLFFAFFLKNPIDYELNEACDWLSSKRKIK
jgi:hypothetical protein